MNRRFAVLGLCVFMSAVALVAGAAVSTASSSGSKYTSRSDAKISGTITVWDYLYKLSALPGYTKAAAQVDAQFERLHPGVKVNHVAQGSADYPQLLQTAFTSHQVPDVAVLEYGANGVLRWYKGLSKLNDLVTPAMHKNLGPWQAVTPGFTGVGAIYGIPVGLQGNVFYYNKTLFAKAGLPTNFQPKSWNDIKAAGLKLKAAGLEAFSSGDKEGVENSWWFTVGMQTGSNAAQMTQLANGKIPYTSAVVAKAFAPYKLMQDAGLFPDTRFTTSVAPDGYQDFVSGKAGMYLGLWSGVAYYGNFIPTIGEKNVGLFFPPQSTFLGDGHVAWTIPSGAKNTAAAQAYVKYVTSPAAATVFYRVGGILPNDKRIPIAKNAPLPERQLIAQIRGKKIIVWPRQMIPGTVEQTMDSQISEWLQGRTQLGAVQEAMAQTAKKAGP